MVKDMNFQRIELLHNFCSIKYRYTFSAKDNKNNFYAIPACAGNVLKYNVDTQKLDFLEGVANTDFAYAGGVFDEKRQCIWGFPRNSNMLLRVDVQTDEVEEIPLNMDFEASGMRIAHHYSGVMVNDCLYCPPRRMSDGILKISLDTLIAEIIPLDKYAGFVTHYSGSIVHPNGNIYFLPSANNRVAVFDPVTNEVHFIGEPTNYMNFGGAIWEDGNIYSICEAGIAKIDVNENTVKIVNDFKIESYVYGTKKHINGKLYGFCNRNTLIEYDPSSNVAVRKAVFHDLPGVASVCTMGEIMDDGNIYLAPCHGRFFMRCVFA